MKKFSLKNKVAGFVFVVFSLNCLFVHPSFSMDKKGRSILIEKADHHRTEFESSLPKTLEKAISVHHMHDSPYSTPKAEKLEKHRNLNQVLEEQIRKGEAATGIYQKLSQHYGTKVDRLNSSWISRKLQSERIQRNQEKHQKFETHIKNIEGVNAKLYDLRNENTHSLFKSMTKK